MVFQVCSLGAAGTWPEEAAQGSPVRAPGLAQVSPAHTGAGALIDWVNDLQEASRPQSRGEADDSKTPPHT